ncbi:MAG: LTA synthase family protein [Candidatus Megaira endosymbiont of Mesostigma viride]|nr:MAG: LTA synthase family protein [Candidatus Megaira endosymbiont of Mesostigma viride]HJK87931.1 LTA synthase family protein [Candidatus Megaira endosymbiont of Mesostigma viride]
MLKSFFDLTIIRIYLIFQFVTRACLGLFGIIQNQIAITELPGIFLVGIINDFIAIAYFLPLALVISSCFHRVLRNKITIYKICSLGTYFLINSILIFTLIAQIIFWEEFGTNFNFIAVDYLIYTHEIIGTVVESLPIYKILVAFTISSILLTYFLRNYIFNQISQINIRFYLAYALSLFALSLGFSKFYESEKFTLSTNRYAIEIGKNGGYEFFTAFFNNSLNYDRFYQKLPKDTTIDIVRTNIIQPNQEFLNNKNIERYVNKNNNLETKKYNVVLIMVESLSAKFMGKFGNTESITPNLDKLADDSIFFTNFYATGTRTVRGLEAVSLSVPPTPGSSIIRRPNNANLFNASTIFKKAEYDISFIFGGYSYFDNLNKFFSSNSYKVIDRSNFSSEEISFSNVWGVADEDLLFKALGELDKNYKAGKPFFSLIMTTSNHRPYTFPDGRIDLPSGGGRNAAVKYTDYAIGKFFEEARKKEWFKDTIFVITADHCAASAGKVNLPVAQYHIPLMIYNPHILKPKQVDNLASQIDIIPTILGILNLPHTTKLWGTDILNFPANRAFISTYQLLGYMKDEHLIILAPNSKAKAYQVSGTKQHEIDYNVGNLTHEAISFFQTASSFYENGELTEK